MKEFLQSLFQGFKCWMFHGRSHFDVGAGFTLCAICDAHLLEELIKGEKMSGQWNSGEKPTNDTSCFPRLRPGRVILEEILEQDQLIEKVYRLTADEVKIASTYVDSLLKTRPIRNQEDRAHMAVLELENDPK